MQVDEFVYNLFVLLLPGAIIFAIYNKFAIHGQEQKKLFTFKEIVFVFLASTVCDIFYDICVAILNYFHTWNLSGTLFKLIYCRPYSLKEICCLLFISAIMGVAVVYFENNKILYKILHRFRITNHFGDDDVWYFVCNSPEVQWVFVRDYKYNLVYYGLLEQFSDPGEKKELLLADVSVYNNTTGKFLYDVGKLFISREHNEISIEIITEEMTKTEKKVNKNGKKRKSKTITRGNSEVK